jgi:hypothetical protein
MQIQAPDLTKRAPRSPRVRLGGYTILPRMLDKGRADVAGTLGEFKFNCPLDQEFLGFAGVDAAPIRELLAQDKSDAEVLDWIDANAKNKHSAVEIAAWSAAQESRGPTDLDRRKFFNEYHEQMAPHRKDVAGWFDLLDIDDFVTFGGKP